MSIYDYEARFGASDKTTSAMKNAIEDWFDLYYLADAQEDRDPCQRIAYTVVNKLVKAIFGEYSAVAGNSSYQSLVDALDTQKKTAVQLALIGGECYLKPCPGESQFPGWHTQRCGHRGAFRLWQPLLHAAGAQKGG